MKLPTKANFMITINNSVTLNEAQTRWATHTRKVVTNAVRLAAKRGTEWRNGSVPCVILGSVNEPRYVFGFRRSDTGHVYAYASR